MTNKEPRLRFSDEERSEQALKKPIRKAEKAAAKADKAQEKIPKRKVPKIVMEEDTGKITARLVLEDKKKPPSKLTHSLMDAPANGVTGQVHKQIRETEDDNVGVESAHKSEEAVESGLRIAQQSSRSRKLKPYREAARAEAKLEQSNVEALYQKSLRDDPQAASNPVSRWRQKQAIKKQYAAWKRTGETASAGTSAARTMGEKAQQAAKNTGAFFIRHKKGALVLLGALLLAAFFLSAVSSCSVIAESVLSGVASGSYAASEEAILDAEAAYCAKEAALRQYLDDFENSHSYDEYAYDLDDIGHDPYVLTAILSALHPGDWTLSGVSGTLDMLFEKQYTLTVDVDTETRYRRPDTLEDVPSWYPDAEEYEYTRCTVTLENFDLSHLPVYIMDEDTLSMYALYMATLGGRPDLFPDSDSIDREYTDYDIPPEALENQTFANMIAEAEKYLGYPYVWGGSSPSTSFDCSGFVSWVINHCGNGWNVGRLSAQGLYNICTPVSRSNARPGDLVFFRGTYDTPGISHVGIYAGTSMMIHCGNPISYTNLNTNYWQRHFYSYGRLH